MSTPTPKDKTPLQKAIDQVLTEMDTVTADSDEFAKMVDQLVTLQKALPEKVKLKWEPLIAVAGNLLGILLILHYEKLDVIASKSLGFVLKSRL